MSIRIAAFCYPTGYSKVINICHILFQEADFVNFMKDPFNPMASMPPPPPSPETHWTDVEGGENVHHLTETNYESFMREHDSVLVMFYAPCKLIYPNYGKMIL